MKENEMNFDLVLNLNQINYILTLLGEQSWKESSSTIDAIRSQVLPKYNQLMQENNIETQKE